MTNLKEYANEVSDFAAPYLKKAGEYIYIAKDGVIHHYQNGKAALNRLRGGKKESALDKAVDLALFIGAGLMLVGSLAMLLFALKRRDD